MIRVLFVCLGNICRSPLAEGIFQSKVDAAGLGELIQSDSAGTGSWHIGDPPDSRMIETARRHGIQIGGLRGRQFRAEDHTAFDYILAMDHHNLSDILAMRPRGELTSRSDLFRSFDPSPDNGSVPDPYYGRSDGFERVYEIVERTSVALLESLVEKHELPQ